MNQMIYCKTEGEVDAVLHNMGQEGMRLVTAVFRSDLESWYLFFTRAS